MEKIVREFFPYITETETTTFTDCVRCLLTFTNSRFNSDVSLNAIAFLRFCAVRLADGGLVCNKKSSVDGASVVIENGVSDVQAFSDNDDHVAFWIPLLSGNVFRSYLVRNLVRWPLHYMVDSKAYSYPITVSILFD